MQISRSAARSARRLSLALIAGTVALGAAVPAAQADLKVSKNYRLPADQNPFRGKDQVNLAVNPNNPNHIVAANVDFLDEHCEASASFDGGRTWSPAFQLEEPTVTMGAPFMPSCRVSNHSGESMFDAVAFGSGQNVYATSITPRATGAAEEGAATLIYKSTDGGVTWSNAVVAMPGGPGGNPAVGPYYELPVVLVDPGAGTNGQDRVYSVARDTFNGTDGDVVRVARSDDGGATFGAPVEASPDTTANVVDAAHAVIDDDGNIGITYRTRGDNTQPAAGNPGEIHFVRSTDDGQTWSDPVVVTIVTNRALQSSSAVNLAPSTASSFPRMAVNPQNGNLYIVYNQGAEPPTAPPGGYDGADHFIPPDTDVYFQRSLDDGATWSEPELINDTTLHPGVQRTQTRHPDVSVAPNGRVDIVWEDRRHWYQPPGDRQCPHTHRFCQEARLGDTYYAYSTDHGGSFSDDRRITDHSHNNDVGYDYRFATYWAFGPQAVPIGSDKILVGWMDSREGNWDNDNQDFYLAQIDHAASSAIPQERIDQPGPVSLSVALSQRTYPGGGEGLMASSFATRNGTRVVIVNRDDVPGALAGSVLARANLGPVLLSPAGGLPESVKAEISRLNPAGAYVIGDASKLSSQVVADLTAAGVGGANIERLSGAGDSDTAAQIALAMDRRTDAEKAADQPAFDAVIIANPSSPDAVAASALAAARRLPILYVSQNGVPAATAAALTTLDIDRTLVIGNTSQVGNGLALPGTSERLGGSDVYATSRAVAAESVERGLPTNIVYVASGTRPMDAALLGFAVGRSTGTMVLAEGAPTATAAATAAGAGLTGIDRLVVVEAAQPGPPATPPGQTPPPPPPPAPPPAGAAGKATAKLSLARATINRRDRVLDVLAPITSLASGRVNVELHAAGRRFRFTAPVNSADARIRFRQRIPAAQARMGTGILTIRYNGDADTRPQTVRLRAALQKAQLRLTRPTIANNGRLRASGTVSNRARGVVRVQLEYFSGGQTRTHQFLARINNGRWSLNHRLSQTIRNEIATRTGTVHSYTLFTGYLPARMRGEMRSFQILGAR